MMERVGLVGTMTLASDLLVYKLAEDVERESASDLLSTRVGL